jgi:hypothetical protein
MFEWGYLPPRRDKRPNQHRLTPEQLAEGRAKGRKSSKGKLRGDRLYYQALVALRRNISDVGIKAAQKWVEDNPEEHSRRTKVGAKERAIKIWAKDGSMRKVINQKKIDRAMALRGDSKAYKRPPRVEKR